MAKRRPRPAPFVIDRRFMDFLLRFAWFLFGLWLILSLYDWFGQAVIGAAPLEIGKLMLLAILLGFLFGIMAWLWLEVVTNK